MSARGGKASGRQKKQKKANRRKPNTRHNAFLDEDPVEVKRTPVNQVGLTEEKLKEEFTKMLVAINPNTSDNYVQFNNTEGKFIETEGEGVNAMVHLQLASSLCHVDSDEAARQQAEEIESERQKRKQLTGEDADEKDRSAEENRDNEERHSPRPLRVKLLKNQFNFSERACQTLNHPARDRETQTMPPPTNNFIGQVDQAMIFDTYLSELMRKRASKPSDTGDQRPKVPTTTYDQPHQRILSSPVLTSACNMMERVVNQNVDQAVYHDYKYYETEEQDAPNGHLLPLWSFKYHLAKKKTVTALCWNPKFTDLFAAAFGSYDFMRQTKGLVCCYTLKNTGHPEYSFQTESGVMCLDFHPQYPALLAVGMYDGNVSVYDVRAGEDEPIYRSDDPSHAHKDPVWQVRWQMQEMSSDLSFYSISSDGRISRWIMTQNEMVCEDLLSVKSIPSKQSKSQDLNLLNISNGCCFDFHPKSSHQILVGTEEGYLHQCNGAYTAEYTKTYKGHKMSIYTVKWNPFHDRTFLTASDDWTLKMWNVNDENPVISYDLKTSVSDVCWAPFCSTLFAACTSDGRIHIFNLQVNKNGPLISQRVVKKERLTHIAFAADSPIVIAGDDRGTVVCLKLSKKLLHGIKNFTEVDHEAENERLKSVLTITGSNVLDLQKQAS